MAKKKKQKKGSLVKKKQAKTQKRKVIIKKQTGHKPTQNKMSVKKLKDNLSKVSTLIFEPEINSVQFDIERIKEVKEQYSMIPDQIEAIADQEFQASLIQPLKDLEARLTQENEQSKQVMAKAMIYYTETSVVPSYFNQIIVAIYLKQLREMNGEEAVTLDNVVEIIEEYEKENNEILENKSKSLEANEPSDPNIIEGEVIEDDDEIDEANFEGIIAQFKLHLKSDGAKEGEIEEHSDNIEVFLEDYIFSERNVSEVSQIKEIHINSFIGNWFVKMMNPVDEDIKGMNKTLSLFFDYAKNNGLIDEDKFNKISANINQSA